MHLGANFTKVLSPIEDVRGNMKLSSVRIDCRCSIRGGARLHAGAALALQGQEGFLVWVVEPGREVQEHYYTPLTDMVRASYCSQSAVI
jgi:hypothetical protein